MIKRILKKLFSKRHQTKFLFVFLILCCSQLALADAFIIKKIDIRGLQGISRGTVLNYLPVSVGDELTTAKSASILRTLYGTGFFENIQLSREGNTLVINVVERPVIGSIHIVGNTAIKKDDLQTVLKNIGLVTGNVFNQQVLHELKQGLAQAYVHLGYYGAQIDVATKPEPRNRVGVTINVHQGSIARIARIDIIGNHAFSESELRQQFVLKPSGLFTWITQKDRYSKEKLDASLEALRSYYMDRGYLFFKILSSNVTLSPDKKKVYITVKVQEGDLYHFSGYDIRGQLILPKKQLQQQVTIVPGAVFSRQDIATSTENIGTALGDLGYAFAQISSHTTLDQKAKTVYVTFFVAPGKKVYVRRVIFNGNYFTGDYVMRRYTQQMEGGLLKTSQVKSTVRQLNLLGYFKSVDVKTIPVPGTNNQVDLQYDLVETPAGQASVGAGYGTLGYELNAGINQPNFLGTGRTVGLNFDHTPYSTSYSFNYYNPFYTLNNIGRGFRLFYSKFNPGKINLADTYQIGTYGGAVYYNIPMTLNNNLEVGYGFKRINLGVTDCPSSVSGCVPPSTQVISFIAENGTVYNIPYVNAGWDYNGLDRAMFPTSGLKLNLGSEVSVPVMSKKTLDYYKVGSSADYYFPINQKRTYIFQVNAGVGYGSGYDKTKGLPFLMNYYAGGLADGLVRGYETNSLGPVDSNGQQVGGNLLVHGTFNFIFPSFVAPDALRTSAFVDWGNVYQTGNDPSLAKTGAGPIRYSAGFAVEWRSPIGLLSFSLAQPLNKRPGDESEFFQFTMGTEF